MMLPIPVVIPEPHSAPVWPLWALLVLSALLVSGYGLAAARLGAGWWHR